jgi:exopolysaccharide biosynthesis predicted pyruvyltransferase EpsI
MFDNSDPYFKFLAGQRGKTFHLYPYVGNSGDSLIRMGTVRLLTDLGIASTLDPRKADVILWPGGNPTMWYDNVEGWRKVLQKYDHAKLVVGPATFQPSKYDWAGVLRHYAPRVTALYARDLASYHNLTSASLPGSIALGLGHDPALYLRGSDWVERHRAAATEDYILAAFRDDHEGCVGPRWCPALLPALLPRRLRRYLERRACYHSQKMKILSVMKYADSRRAVKASDISHFDFDSFVDAVCHATEVHTDRLHTMLLAVLFDKRVFAYSTSYGKLEAVYSHSLKDWARVEFVSGMGSSPSRAHPRAAANVLPLGVREAREHT